MKTKSTLGLGILLGGLLMNCAWAQRVTPTPTQIFMRQKLGYSQNVVEGLALERYDLIATNAFKMWRMTQTNTWTKVKNLSYQEKSVQFQVDTADLMDAARAGNTTQALEAYGRVTADCVSCHQYVRREQVARRFNPEAPQAAAGEKSQATPTATAAKK